MRGSERDPHKGREAAEPAAAADAAQGQGRFQSWGEERGAGPRAPGTRPYPPETPPARRCRSGSGAPGPTSRWTGSPRCPGTEGHVTPRHSSPQPHAVTPGHRRPGAETLPRGHRDSVRGLGTCTGLCGVEQQVLGVLRTLVLPETGAAPAAPCWLIPRPFCSSGTLTPAPQSPQKENPFPSRSFGVSQLVPAPARRERPQCGARRWPLAAEGSAGPDSTMPLEPAVLPAQNDTEHRF